MSVSSYLETVNNLLSALPEIPFPKKKGDHCPPVLINQTEPQMAWIVRIAGVSGAAAVCLGAYGSHVLRDDPSIEERRKKAFDTGSRYHLIHTVALLATPKARYPALTSALLGGGILLFCGSCYHFSFTGEERTRRFTPLGGIMLIVGWLSFIL